ncbi:MAG: hypothetical protein ACI4RD_08085 [Kiritimatiellia bacterium]
MFNAVYINCPTELMVAATILLLVLSFVLKMHERGIYPLRELTQLLRRPWFEAVLLTFFAGGLVQFGATKGTNGTERGELMALLRSPAPAIMPVAVDSAGFSTPANLPPVTNLCCWGIEREDETVSLGIAWPPEMSFTNDCIDIFGCHRLASNGWWRLAQLDVGQIGSNAIVELAYADLPTNAMQMSAFYRLASQDDSDGDGLTDKVEEWILGTDPKLSDTDDDGLLDGEESALGVNPVLLDSDADGVCDGDEVGYLRVANRFVWHDTSALAPTYNTGYMYEEAGTGISSWWCQVTSRPMYSSHVVCGLPLSSVIAFETGYIAFSSDGDSHMWVFPPGPTALDQDVFNSGSIMVAAYWNQSYLYNGNTNSYIKAGTVSDGTFVVEFHDVRKAPYSALGMTYQVSVPSGTGNVIRVSYLSSDCWMDGDGAVVGVQNKRIVTSGGYYNLTWNFAEMGPILPRTTIEFHLGIGTDPLAADSDADGLDDGAERALGTTPTHADSDGDGLADGMEVSVGLDPRLTDTDGDGLKDGWEVANGLDPLVAEGVDGASADLDNDGLSNSQEQDRGTDPWNDDSDGDGFIDGVEVNTYGTDPTKVDTDADGLSDFYEVEHGLNPTYKDSDGDGMADGWEVENGLDPQNATEADGASGDVDHDGLCNYNEFQLGCDPGKEDSDGDGVSDYHEICNGSDPTDWADQGVASGSFPDRGMTFNVNGDYAAWRMTIAGRGPIDYQSDTVSMASPGAGSEKMKILKKGNSYRLTMKWLNSNGHTNPNWYCWQAKVNGLPATASYQSYTTTRLAGNEIVCGSGWMAENHDGLLTSHVHTCDGAGGNVAEGLEALLHVYKCEITVCNPDDESWTEIEQSRVLLDDEDLKVKIKISPAIPTFDLCRQIMGSNVVVATSGTCPDGAAVPIAAAEFVNFSSHSEIKLTKTREQLSALGLLPSQDEDGVEEMAAYDVGTLAGSGGSDLSDCFAFEQMAKACRGRVTNELSLTLDANPPTSGPSESFFKAAGAEVLTVFYGGVRSAKRQIMNQADYFYYSGHGHHRFGMVDDFVPDIVSDYWRKDLDCVIFAGCSVLDINDYNNNFLNPEGVWDPEDHAASPGKLWEVKGPSVLLGYNYHAPQDSTHAPERIVRAWLAFRQEMGDVDAWMKANDNANGRNACAIVKNEKYVYSKKILPRWYRKVEVRKENW